MQPQRTGGHIEEQALQISKRYGGPFGYNFGEQQASSGKHLSDQRQIVNVDSMWHAHLAREFKGGTPVPLLKKLNQPRRAQKSLTIET